MAFNEACAVALTSVRLSRFWRFCEGTFAVAATAELATAAGGLVDVVSTFTVATLGIVVRFPATKTSGLENQYQVQYPKTVIKSPIKTTKPPGTPSSGIIAGKASLVLSFKPSPFAFSLLTSFSPSSPRYSE